MKKTLLISIIISALVQTAFSQQSFFPPLEKYKLKNGLEIIFADYGTLPVTAINVYINTGTKNETPGMQSIATLTSNAILLGSQKYNREKQDEWLSQMGTSISSSINNTYTQISAQFINADIEKGVDILSGVLLQPLFPKEDISMMIKQQIDYNKPSRMDIQNLAAVFSNLFVFGSSNPLGRYFYPAQLNKINRDTISEFYKFNYTPKNTKIIISGKPEKEKVKQLLEKYFAAWHASYGEINGVAYDMLPIKKKEYGFVNKTKAKQTALQWNKKAPDAKSKEVLPFQIAATIFNDIMFEEIRAKKGYTYGIRLNYSSADNNGLYMITTMVRNEVVYDCINEFDRVLKEFYDKGLTEAQLNIAKTRMKGNVFSIETPAAFLSEINPMIYSDYEKRKQFFTEIDKLDLATVNKIIKKYYTPDTYKLVIAADETAINDQLNKLPGLIKFNLKDIEKDF